MKFFNENNSNNYDEIYEKAETLINENRINMKDFEKLYGAENIERDTKYVKKLKKKMKDDETPKQIEAKKLATIFETIINENTELSDWLGPNANTAITTEYDDIVNGVDTIVEITEEEKSPTHLGLAINATYSNLLQKKFEKIKSNIDKGKLATIKYFKSSNMNFTGELSKIPRVIISVNSNTVKELTALWEKGDKKKPCKTSYSISNIRRNITST